MAIGWQACWREHVYFISLREMGWQIVIGQSLRQLFGYFQFFYKRGVLGLDLLSIIFGALLLKETWFIDTVIEVCTWPQTPLCHHQEACVTPLFSVMKMMLSATGSLFFRNKDSSFVPYVKLYWIFVAYWHMDIFVDTCPFLAVIFSCPEFEFLDRSVAFKLLDAMYRFILRNRMVCKYRISIERKIAGEEGVFCCNSHLLQMPSQISPLEKVCCPNIKNYLLSNLIKYLHWYLARIVFLKLLC